VTPSTNTRADVDALAAALAAVTRSSHYWATVTP